MINQAVQSKIAENKHVVFQIVHAITFLCKQGLPLQGDIETVAPHNNPGNFLALLKVFAENNSVLHAHLHWPRARNATYLSPKLQNDIIEVIDFDVIRTSIVTEVRNAVFYSILADEV